MIVTKESKVILDDQEYLLEVGDRIFLEQDEIFDVKVSISRYAESDKSTYEGPFLYMITMEGNNGKVSVSVALSVETTDLNMPTTTVHSKDKILKDFINIDPDHYDIIKEVAHELLSSMDDNYMEIPLEFFVDLVDDNESKELLRRYFG
ncbi:MAG: hypothetical protein GF411_18890 [Candidatus Lokiarchaeota archaeon]|nr:hypothetical protein [Candidatus Lokiarchaeota archaeon]